MNQPLFFQTPPVLPNPYATDRSLRSHLHRLLGEAIHKEIEPSFQEMGALSSGSMLPLMERAERNPPKIVHYSSYGRRIDTIEVEPAWYELGKIAARTGLIAIPHERKHGWRSRVHQYALLHLYTPSSAFFSCPLAMSDGAVAALRAHGDGEYAQRAIHHLTSRDPEEAWTSGQWMTEKERRRRCVQVQQRILVYP